MMNSSMNKSTGSASPSFCPSYKSLCKKNYKKKIVSDKISHDRQTRADLKQLKKQENEDFAYLKDTRRRQQVELQMNLNTVADIAIGQIPYVGAAYMGYKANNIANTIENATNTITRQITETLEMFRASFESVKQYFSKTIDLLGLIGDIMSTLLHVSFAAPGYKLASLGVSLFSLLPRYGLSMDLIGDIKDYVYSFLGTVTEKVKNMMKKEEVQLQMNMTDATQNISETFMQYAAELTPTQIIMFLLSILSAVFLGALPKATQMESILKRVGDICRSGKSIYDFNSTMHTCLLAGLDLFKKDILGIHPPQEIEKFISGIEDWFKDIESFFERTGDARKSDLILKDPHIVIEVENLYKRGLEFSKEIADKRIEKHLQLPFQLHMRTLSDLMKVVDTSGAFGTKPRTQPVVIWLFGESGVGKSGMSWPLAVDMNNLFVQSKEEAREFSKHIYMRNVEQEFWDNYQGQNVVIYDDFGQRVDSASKPNEEFMELIRTANIAPYPLHMAHLEDKRKTRFTSKVLLLTSNVFEQSVNSLTFPDAFRRRIDLCARVTNKTEFTKAGYSSSKGECVQRLDKQKVLKETGEIISTDVYELELVDPESGIVLESALSYDEFLDRCLEKATDAFYSSKMLNEFLENYGEKRFANSKAYIDDLKKRIEKSKTTPVEMQVTHIYGETDTEAFATAKETFHDCVESVSHTTTTHTFEFKTLIGRSMDDIESICKKGDLYTIAQDKVKSVEDMKVEIMQYFLDNEEYDGDLDDEMSHKISQIIFMEKKMPYANKLRKMRQSFMSGIRSWASKTMQWIKEHPFMIAASVIGAISSIFVISKIWTKIVSKPEKIKRVSEADLNGVKVQLYDDKTPVQDFSNLNQSQLISVLPNILSEAAFAAGTAFLFRRPYPLVMGMIAGMRKGITIYIRNKIFDWHGVKYEMVAPATKLAFERANMFNVLEAQVSSDAVTLKQPTIKLEAQPSGDVVTMAKPAIKMEAFASADAKTLAKPNIRMEAFASADAKTLAKPTIKMEAFASADAKTLAKPTIRLESNTLLPADMEIWKDQIAQNLIGHSIFSNMYKICKVVEGDNVIPLVNGLFVRGRTMLAPGHLVGFLNNDDTIEITNSFNPRFRVPWKDIVKQIVENSKGESKEAVLLGFPCQVNGHRDLVKQFSDSTSMGQYKRAEVCIPTYRYSDKFKALLMTILGNFDAEAMDEPVLMEDRATKFTTCLRQGLSYVAPTMQGDCGAPVIVNETQVLRKIAGIHVAGKAGGRCLAESITQADLERTLSKIGVEFQIQLDFDTFVKPPQFNLPTNVEFDPRDYLNCKVPADTFLPVGEIPEVLRDATETNIRPSVIHDKLEPPTMKPANLRNLYVDGKLVNLKHLNLKKCALNTPYIDPDLVERAFQLTKKVWLKNRRPELARVLTWEESICGNSESEYISSINRQSSPGYPWITKRKTGQPGKTAWFGNDQEYVLNDEVKAAVDYRIEQAKKGIRTPTVWIDTLKDERRPIAKVDALKTRVFSNGPMDYNIAFRQYFLGFIAHLMENRIDNEVSIGTNVYSSDWARTAKKLMKKGKKVIAGDFSTFDGTLNSCIMARFVDMANEFYDDGEENALIRQVLFLEVYNSVHLCDGTVYMMNHSQPSGNPATTPLNCFINSMGLRICFEICAKMASVKYSMKQFDEHVSMVSYGDDNVINFSDIVSPWFNMDTITEAFARIGFIYTDETKSERGTAPLWRELREVAYLKRNFRFDEERRVWEAPLSMDTIKEMPLWCRGKLDEVEGTKVNCENAIMELSMHERPVFEEWSKKISKAFYDATNQLLDIDTYKGYAESRYMEYYL